MLSFRSNLGFLIPLSQSEITPKTKSPSLSPAMGSFPKLAYEFVLGGSTGQRHVYVTATTATHTPFLAMKLHHRHLNPQKFFCQYHRFGRLPIRCINFVNLAGGKRSHIFRI
jgi:hypothetical protein